MARFKLLIEYAGTRYSGWQIQKNARTVQGEIDRVVGQVTGQKQFEIYGSGRTDAGVHALAQVAHLDVITALPARTLQQRINDGLPSDINILSIELAQRRFHARHDAVARSYLYQVSRRRTAFAKNFVWWVRDELDLARMRATGDRFAGMKDFRSFTDDSADEKSTLVAIERIEMNVDAAQAGFVERLGHLLEQDGIGGERQIPDTGNGNELSDQNGKVPPHQRFATRDPQLGDSQTHGDAHETLDLFKRQDLAALHELDARLGHAVEAADIAPVSYADAKIVVGSPKRIDERTGIHIGSIQDELEA